MYTVVSFAFNRVDSCFKGCKPVPSPLFINRVTNKDVTDYDDTPTIYTHTYPYLPTANNCSLLGLNILCNVSGAQQITGSATQVLTYLARFPMVVIWQEPRDSMGVEDQQLVTVFETMA